MCILFFVIAVILHVKSAEVVAVGDLHGDFENAVKAFSLVGVIAPKSKKYSLVRNNTNQIIIQTGDVLDRGRHGLLLLQLMMQWHKESNNFPPCMSQQLTEAID